MSIKKNVTRAAVILASLAAAPAFAVDPTIDVSGATAVVSQGLTAVGVIGAAFIAVTVLQRVWRRIGG